MFDKIPKEFLEGITIVPNNFNTPEHQQHAEWVDTEMKYNWFNSTFMQINRIEVDDLTSECQLKLEKISECQKLSKNDTIYDKLHKTLLHRKNPTLQEDKLIRCENWTINLNNKTKVNYRIEFKQSENDRFYSILTAPTLWKQIKIIRKSSQYSLF